MMMHETSQIHSRSSSAAARTSMQDIFERLKTLAKNRESVFENQIKQQTKIPSQDCRCQGKIFFVDETVSPKAFAICKACDPCTSCALCSGSGNVVFTSTAHLKAEDEYLVEGKILSMAPRSCSCLEYDKILQRLNKAQIPERYMTASFSGLRLDHLPTDNLKQKLSLNIKTVESFCETVVHNRRKSFSRQDSYSEEKASSSQDISLNSKYFLALSGSVGTGKTLLATAGLKNLIINHGLTGMFVDFQYLLNQLKAEYEEKKSGEKLMQELRQTGVLLIDEFGKGRSESEWLLEKLDDLVNARYNSQKITLLTTNFLLHGKKYTNSEIPSFYRGGSDSYEAKLNQTANFPINEQFWGQSLLERIGQRMYDRILEVSVFVDFLGFPSFRKFEGKNFLNKYAAAQKNGDKKAQT